MNKERIEEKALKIYPENFAWVRCDEDSETYTEIDADGIKWLKVDANKTYREGYIKALLEIESKKKTLKSIIDNNHLIDDIVKIALDPTIESKGEQIKGLLFMSLTDDYWDYVESLSTVKGLVARDEDGCLKFFDEKPIREENFWINTGDQIQLKEELFPDVTWESEPIEVELNIRKL